ncbi:putative Rho GTPase activator Rga [Aspergillus lucknowensis]|uniref:Rho GTPase activator Rga n=1 Tax=Aspergillus lucknowensis TaxID=176173 RepID=A0ABR4LLA2_9EURO
MESPTSYAPESPMEQEDVPFPCKGCGEILEEGKAFELGKSHAEASLSVQVAECYCSLAGNRWHIDCFRCSSCGTLLDSDAHLLLLGDGSLICSNCTYSCSSCGNKIEDLAILTGEQAFCAQCFRCRNCKRKIENLRYARTSQGIFCMDCHESLMQRRRKKNRGVSSKKHSTPGMKLDKSLPSLPPEDAEAMLHAADDLSVDGYADGTTVSASRRTAPALDAGRTESTHLTTDDKDNLILPSSTYRSNRQSVVPTESDADGGEFLIPLAFDPSEEQRPSRNISTNHIKSPERLPLESSSPHIAYQEKGRERPEEPSHWRQDDSLGGSSIHRVARSNSIRSSRSDIPVGHKVTGSYSSTLESAKSSATFGRDASTADSRGSTAVESTTTLPTRPSQELHRLHENGGSTDSSSAAAHPKRGDSLESRSHQLPRKELVQSPSGKSVSPTDQWTERSTDTMGKGTPQSGESPRSQRNDPSEHARIQARPNSISALQQSEPLRPAEYSPAPSPLRYSAGGDFSMDEDMARILGSEDVQPAQSSESFLRRMSNSVRHGRSFSDKGSRLPKDSKWPKTPVNGSSSVTDITAAPASSPEQGSTDELAWLRGELRKERQRVLDREKKIAEMESVLKATADVKQVNTELNEKRSTMVVLDAQKEIVMRELTVLTEHLESEKRGGSSGPLDLGKLTNKVLRDFVESIQNLKDSFTPQIEEMIQRRNEAAEELANLNRMKDKSFQEFEQLSSKNAQLAELNNQLVHQIQELYKANSTEGSRGANGLGIYSHGKEKSLSSIDALKAATELPPSVSTPNMSEEAEPATVVPGPQVVSIRKGQVRKFNWKKGGQNVAKGVTKGIKGAFMSSESNASGIDSGTGLPRSQTQDPSRQGFGFFGNQRNKQTGARMPQTDSVPALAEGSPTGLFGTDLEQRMEQEKSIIPGIVTRCIQEVELRGMDMEGIYRKSGASSAIQTIREGFERSPQDYDISDLDLDIHAVTSALKQYFRKLPVPLITYDVYEKIIETGEITSRSARIESMQKSLGELPRVHQDVLEFLVFHLKRVVEREKENLMTSQNIAVVFAPTIMRPQSLAREMTDVQKKNEVVKFLVENCQEVFMGMQNHS